MSLDPPSPAIPAKSEAAEQTKDLAPDQSTQVMPLSDDPVATNEQANVDDSEIARPVQNLIRRIRGISGRSTPAYELDSSTRESHVDDDAPTIAHSTQPTSTRDDRSIDQSWLQLSVGTRIGRFEIKRFLGRGGFGIVVLAHDPQLERLVALKIPRFDTLISNEGLARFLREARAAAMLGHPNIVPVFEAGQIGPIGYIAFEFVDGNTLQHWLQNQPAPLELDSVADVMMALASAVQHAHSRGIIHRDLKPSNILVAQTNTNAVEKEGSAGNSLAQQVKISDFGMARIDRTDELATQTGAMVGTPIYMAPELIRGSNGRSAPAVDIYGLGTIFYECLTGRPPFHGSSIADVLKVVEFSEPTPPGRIRHDIPKDLEAICLKCLEKQPARRYSSAHELEQDLLRWRQRLPVQARRITRLDRCWRWVRRNQAIATLASLLLLSLITGLVFSLVQLQKARSLFATAEGERLRAEQHVARVERAIDQMLNRVVDVMQPYPQMHQIRAELLQQALDLQTELVAVESTNRQVQINTAVSWTRMAELRFQLGDFAAAQADVEQALEQLRRLEVDRNTVAVFHRREAELLQSRIWTGTGRLDDALELLKRLEAEVPWREVYDGNPAKRVQTAKLLNQLATTHKNAYQLAESIYWQQQGLEFLSATPEAERSYDENVRLADLLVGLGTNLMSRGDFESAEPHLLQAIPLCQRLLDEHPELYMQQWNLTRCYFEFARFRAHQERRDEAADYYQTALTQSKLQLRRCPDFEIVRYLHAKILVGICLNLQNRSEDDPSLPQRFKEAREFLRESPPEYWQIAKWVEIKLDLNSCEARYQFEQRKDFASAEKLMAEQIELSKAARAQFPDESVFQFTVGRDYYFYAKVQFWLGNVDASIPSITRAVDEAFRALELAPESRMHLLSAVDSLTLASYLHSARGDVNQAFAYAERLIDLGPPSAQRYLRAARSLSNSLAVLEGRVQPGQLTDADRQRIASLVLDCLETAVALGADNLSWLSNDADFRCFHENAEFLTVINSSITPISRQ